MSDLERIANAGLLKFAVGRKVFCPSCGGALSTANAVLITSETGAGIACGDCFDREAKAIGPLPDGLEIIDGRSQ